MYSVPFQQHAEKSRPALAQALTIFAVTADNPPS
jgi:hypothetical protein